MSLPVRLAPALLALLSSATAGQVTELISAAHPGQLADSHSGDPQVSADGRYVVFSSRATNLVALDTNGREDVFLFDGLHELVIRVSTNGEGDEANHVCQEPTVSANGRYVVFESYATNLVAGVSGLRRQLYRKDRLTGDVTLVSQLAGGPEADAHCQQARLDGSGRFVVFASQATNLGAPSSSTQQVYLRDMLTQQVTLVSARPSDGLPSTGSCANPEISENGAYVVFSTLSDEFAVGDDDADWDVVRWRRDDGSIELVSAAMDGTPSSGMCVATSLSSDGRYVGISSGAEDLVATPAMTPLEHQAYVRDMQAESTWRVSEYPDGTAFPSGGYEPIVSGDGAWVLLRTEESLVPEDAHPSRDYYRCPIGGGPFELMSVDESGLAISGHVASPSLSRDGAVAGFVAYASETPVTAGDSPTAHDVFRRNLVPAQWSLYGQGHPGTLGVPALSLNDDPVLSANPFLYVGSSLDVTTTGFLGIGAAPTSLPILGGTLLVQVVAPPIVLTVKPNGANVGFTLDDEPNLLGVDVYLQVALLDPGASHGFSFTRGLKAVLGH